LGLGTGLIALRPERDHLDAAWADLDAGAWSTGATRLRNAGALKLDPPTQEQMNTIATLLGVPTQRTWLFGRGQSGTTIAIADAPDGMDSADAFASLYEASAGRGRDTTAARNNAMLTERARIAGVIHEGITQVLTNVAIQMEVLDQVMEDPEAARKMVRAMRSAVLEALDSLRGAILELTPNAPEWTDLAGGLERFIGDFGAQWGLELTYNVEGTPRDVDPDVLALVFAFVQESLGNIRKHAGTEVASIGIDFQEETVAVTVEDEGKGFDPAEKAEEGFRLHQGLQIVRSRVRLAGGKLDIKSTPGKGTRMLLEVVA
jgi:signal transduction histidine kinase